MRSSTRDRASGVVGLWRWYHSSISCSRSASFSEGRTRDLAWMPVLRAFMEETALPVTEVGPVDFWALRRLASIWRRVDIWVLREGTGKDACPTFTIKGEIRGIGG